MPADNHGGTTGLGTVTVDSRRLCRRRPLRGEPAAAEVSPLLQAGDASLTAVGLGEVIDHLVRLVGADEEAAVRDVAQLGLLDAMAVDSRICAAAGRLRARHYHRIRCSVSMADCIAAETARHTKDALVRSDPHLLDVSHAEGIGLVGLPGSDGSRWLGRPDVAFRLICDR
ncbi:MAG: PIN domain-containing protein [Acidimicrobiales bacterium]